MAVIFIGGAFGKEEEKINFFLGELQKATKRFTGQNVSINFLPPKMQRCLTEKGIIFIECFFRQSEEKKGIEFFLVKTLEEVAKKYFPEVFAQVSVCSFSIQKGFLPGAKINPTILAEIAIPLGLN